MAVKVPVPHVPPIWRESLIGLEAAGLLRSPVFRGVGVERGEGDPILLIPGFMAGDGSLGVMAKWLRAMDYRTKSAGIRMNVGCSETLALALEERLECLAEKSGTRVAIIGQSRGGILGKVLAARRPDLVSGIITLGSPTVNMLSGHPLLIAQIGIMGALGTVKVPGVLTANCLRGECCRPFRESLEGTFPDDVSFTSVFSRKDGIVNWRACVDPAADEHVEVVSTHCGMSVHAPTYRIIANALARFREGDAWPGAWFAKAA